MNRPASSPLTDPMRPDKHSEIGKRIFAIVAFVLLLGGNLFLAYAILFATAFLCMGGSRIWYCSAPFTWGLIIGTVGVVGVSLFLIIQRRYRWTLAVAVTHALVTWLIGLTISAS